MVCFFTYGERPLLGTLLFKTVHIALSRQRSYSFLRFESASSLRASATITPATLALSFINCSIIPIPLCLIISPVAPPDIGTSDIGMGIGGLLLEPSPLNAPGSVLVRQEERAANQRRQCKELSSLNHQIALRKEVDCLAI
jgi:hypothetical protein